MKKLKLIKKSFAILLALLTLTSTTGLAIDAHYCKDNLASISIWGKAKSCIQTPIQEKIDNCKNDYKNQQVSKKSCCSSKNFFSKVEITTDFSSSQTSKEIQYTPAFSSSTLIINTLDIPSFSSIFHFKPPLLDKDFSVSYQNFRI